MPSVTEYQELGKQLFRAGKYERALAQFTLAFEDGDDVSLALLDNRAATLEKLSRLDEALKDGTRMIQSDKRDVRGYLRTGRILRQHEDPGKHELALKVYAKGLRNVPTNHEHYKALRTTHDKLTSALAAPKSMDPFVVLPVELIEMILGYLEFHQMVRYIGVARHWKRFITGRPSAWSDIDFSKAKRVVKNDTFSRYLNRGRHQIRHVTFNRHSHPGSLIALFKTTHSLQTLKFLSTEYGAHSIVETLSFGAKARKRPGFDWLRTLSISEHTVVTLDGVTQIMRLCSGLVTAHFDGIDSTRINSRATWNGTWSNLRELRFQTTQERDARIAPRGDKWNLNKLFPSTTNLESLTVVDHHDFMDLTAPELPQLKTLTLKGRVLLPLALPESLQVLRLETREDALNIQPYPDIAKLLELRTVEASGDFAPIIMQGLEHIPGPLPWRRLVLDWRKAHHWLPTSHRWLPDGLNSCPDLEELGVNSNHVADDLCESIIKAVPKLKRLSLAGTEITGVTVRTILNESEHLNFLDVSDCHHLGADAVDLARSKGIKVKHQMPKETRGNGRKIRHG